VFFSCLFLRFLLIVLPAAALILYGNHPLFVTEQLLQFIWQFRYFNQQGLQLQTGEFLFIDFPGIQNPNQGPDFLDARINIGKTTWIGSVELHLRASGWNRHAHEHDVNYTNVILHVVWENDHAEQIRNIPVLELQPLVAGSLLHQYAGWMNDRAFIPCRNTLHHFGEERWSEWKGRLLQERLERKAASLHPYLLQNNYHWEETLWWLLARNFGMKVNGPAFETVAKSIPISVLGRYRDQPHRLEALLFGQAGMLDGNWTDPYPNLLSKEYKFLKKKFGLPTLFERVHFLRMRPENFPTIRLSQLAVALYRIPHFFSYARESDGVSRILETLMVNTGDYWNDHYLFDKPAGYKQKTLGKQMAANIVINTIIPVLFHYGKMDRNRLLMEKCLAWMRALEPENNGIIRQWERLRVRSGDAADTQALLELKTSYCDKKRCLECAVGRALLR
jgi:Protein of unknown function (DUF2851)